MKGHHKVLVLDMLFEGGRMFVGAMSAIFLLHKGISLSDLAFLKVIQGIVFIIGEFPTGIFGDLKGHHKSLLISLILGLIGLSLYFLGLNLYWFIFAEIFMALSLCFWSGCFEAFLIKSLEKEKDPNFSKIFHLNSSLNSLAIMIFGFLGGILAKINIGIPYIAAILIFLLTIILLLIWGKGILEQSESIQLPLSPLSWPHILTSFFKNKKLVYILMASISIQFLIQPLLHFWQPFIQEVNPSIGTDTLGLIFFIQCGLCSISSFIVSKKTKKPSIGFVFFLLASLSFIFISHITPIIFLIALNVFLTLGRGQLMATFNKYCDPHKRASFLSLLSLISRMGMFFSLQLFIPYSLGKNSLTHLFHQFGLISFVIFLIFIFWNRYSPKQKKGIFYENFIKAT